MEGVHVYFYPPDNGGLLKNHIWYPGDKVTGQVVLILEKDEGIQGVEVIFEGRIYLESGTGDNKSTKTIVLFNFSQTLFRGPFKMRKDTYKYPFSFTFPETWDNKYDYRQNHKEFSQLAHMVGEHPLPPTCERDSDVGGASSIYYQISARVPYNFRNWEGITASVPKAFGKWESTYTVPFSPFRLELEPDPNIMIAVLPDYKRRNFKLSDDGRPRELSIREIVKNSLHRSSDTHTINFSISGKGPTRIVIGNSYSILVTLKTKDTGPESIEPEFRLKSWELKLKARIEYRMTKTHGSSPSVLDATTYLLSSGNLDTALATNTPTPILNLFPKDKKLASGFVPPTFITPAVRRTYVLQLNLVLAYLGEETKWKIKWHGVEVLPQKVDDRVSDALGAVETNMNNGGEGSSSFPTPGDNGGEGSSSLPTYGEHGRTERVMSSEEIVPSYNTSLKD